MAAGMIALVPCAEEHRSSFYDWRNSAEVARFMYDDRPIARADHDEWYTAMLADPLRWGWAVTDDDVPVGAAFLNNYVPAHRRAAFGFYIGDPGRRGRGVGVAALALLCEYAMGELGLHKLIGEALGFNAAAVALYRRLGFRTEGVLREQLLRDGSWTDVELMALFENDLAPLSALLSSLREQGRIA